MADFMETKLRCPYDRHHEIAPDQMAVHLLRCRRQNPHKKLEICPFNSTHHIEPDKFEKHKRDCRYILVHDMKGLFF